MEPSSTPTTCRSLHGAERWKSSKYCSKASGSLRRFESARDLIARAAETGLQVVLATSAPEEEFENLGEVLEIDEHVAAVTSAGDVERAKPAPDILTVAFEKAGVTPDRAIMVGDSVGDVEAAKRAGVQCVVLLSGGTGAAEVRVVCAERVSRSVLRLVLSAAAPAGAVKTRDRTVRVRVRVLETSNSKPMRSACTA